MFKVFTNLIVFSIKDKFIDLWYINRELGNQYVVKSQEAFSRINFLQSTEATADIWYQKKIEREEKAKGLYANSKLEQIKNNTLAKGKDKKQFSIFKMF